MAMIMKISRDFERMEMVSISFKETLNEEQLCLSARSREIM